MFSKNTLVIFSFLFVLMVWLSGCQSGTKALPGEEPTLFAGQITSTATFIPVATTAVPTPTATPEPLAARVNGELITLAEYQAELGQLQEALQTLGKDVPPEQQRQQVLDNLIGTMLLAQGAKAEGFQLEGTVLTAEIDRLSSEMGSPGALQEWINQRGYTEASFQIVLSRQLAAAWQRDRIVAQVPQVDEQIHARQILTQDESIAQRALEQVNLPGVNFAAQALRYDPLTGGDLGWFPRGYLTQMEVEDAVFQLQPGEISPIVKSQVGYHIIQVISREPARLIAPDARRVLQHKVLQDWVQKQRETSQLEVLLP
jgi:peptidyl-prolyl cis-trans isomerase C